ncbi:MAG: hypothetical protein ACK4TA_14145, partial [Saprospiraceae bacterium]
MSRNFILLFLFITCSALQGQSFEGKLIYVYQDVYLDSTIKAKTIQLFGNTFLERKQNSRTTYQIKGANLIGEDRDKSGNLLYQFFQNAAEAYLLTEKGHKVDYASLMSENLENIRCV